jgi:hypothetical protein
MANLEVMERTIEYSGSLLRVLAVRVDGELLSDSFAPFDAATNELHSRICEVCYGATRGSIVSCGPPDYAVRRRGDTIYWYRRDGYWSQDHLNDDETISGDWEAVDMLNFSVVEYESCLQDSSAGLPDFNLEDVRFLLGRCRVFSSDLGLYTIPDLDDDPQGRRLLRGINQLIREGDLTLASAPAQFRTVRVGIETPGIPEMVVQLGRSKQVDVIRLVANPGFPFWLTSPSLAASTAHSPDSP